jgi:hypothetical protein
MNESSQSVITYDAISQATQTKLSGNSNAGEAMVAQPSSEGRRRQQLPISLLDLHMLHDGLNKNEMSRDTLEC